MDLEPFFPVYRKLTRCSREPLPKPGASSNGGMIAVFRLDFDPTPLFPYINAIAKKAALFKAPPMIRSPLQPGPVPAGPDLGGALLRFFLGKSPPSPKGGIFFSRSCA